MFFIINISSLNAYGEDLMRNAIFQVIWKKPLGIMALKIQLWIFHCL